MLVLAEADWLALPLVPPVTPVPAPVPAFTEPPEEVTLLEEVLLEELLLEEELLPEEEELPLEELLEEELLAEELLEELSGCSGLESSLPCVYNTACTGSTSSEKTEYTPSASFNAPSCTLSST